MKCKNCGTDNKSQAEYCKQCGMPLKKEGRFREVKQKRIAAAAVLFLVILCALSVTLYLNHAKEAEYNGVMQTADKYLQKLDYGRAEDAFLKAIKIKPKKEEAYLKLSDVYIRQGEYDKAVKILEKGSTKSKSHQVEKKLETAQLGEQLDFYEPVLEQYQDLMQKEFYKDMDPGEIPDGEELGEYINFELFLSGQRESDTGIYYALSDIDGNGKAEFVIGTNSGSEFHAYDLFVQRDGKPARFLGEDKFGYRSNFKVYENGIFEACYTGSAIDHVYEYYKFGKDGCTPELEETIAAFSDYEDSYDEPKVRYYHDSQCKNEIPEKEFQSIYDRYASCEEIDLQWALLQEGESADEEAIDMNSDSEQTASSQEEAYQNLCMEYTQKYGEGSIHTDTETVTGDTAEIYSLDGLCAVHLLDFNGDGNRELLLAYKETDTYADYYCEIWAWKDGKLENVLPKQTASNVEGVAWIETVCENDTIYFVVESIEEPGVSQYLEYSGSAFEYKFEKRLAEESRSHTYQNENENQIYFPLSSDAHMPTPQEELESYEKVLEHTQHTLEQLQE